MEIPSVPAERFGNLKSFTEMTGAAVIHGVLCYFQLFCKAYSLGYIFKRFAYLPKDKHIDKRMSITNIEH